LDRDDDDDDDDDAAAAVVAAADTQPEKTDMGVLIDVSLGQL